MRLQVWIVFCLLSIAFALAKWGAHEVRTDGHALVFLLMFGWFWLLLARGLFPWLGLSIRDDAVERKNLAACFALAGAILAVALTYAGGNIGEGPSYSENVFSVILSTGGLFGAWLVMELGARVSDSIAEERDLASGLRLGGFLIATSLILARAVAGDWHSAEGTVHDFIHDGWSAAPLLVIALVIERKVRPSRLNPFPGWPGYGLGPAIFYLAFGACWCWHLGAWEGMP